MTFAVIEESEKVIMLAALLVNTDHRPIVSRQLESLRCVFFRRRYRQHVSGRFQKAGCILGS